MSGRGTKPFPEARDLTWPDLRDAVAFSFVPRLGGAALRIGIERYGSAAAAFRATAGEADRAAARRSADEVMARAASIGAHIMVQGEPTYPAVLLELPQPPSLLFALGTPGHLHGRRVGIVGTRHSSASGERIAAQMAAVLVGAGAVVVSGMAFGIDAAAHRGAMDANGGTIAVLGGGADVPYPPAHAGLHDRIVREGLVVSEIPLGSRPGKGAFPRRNRIIAALAETLIVIEAGERSGALITARIAAELGRNVAVVPGPIDSPRHVGSNRLLHDGAAVITRIEDVLSIADLDSPAREAPQCAADGDTADPAHGIILAALRAGAADVEDLGRTTRLSPRDFATALSSLELTGRIHVSATGAVRTV